MKHFNARVGDAAANYLHTGDIVVDATDPRHEGRVEGIHWGEATVKWLDTGWLSALPVGSLKKT